MHKRNKSLPNIMNTKRNKLRKLCCSFFLFLFVLGSIIVFNHENVYAKNETAYSNKSGYCTLRVRVDGTLTNTYTLNCTLSSDIAGVGSLVDTRYTGGYRFIVQDGQSWVEQSVLKVSGDTDTISTNGWAWTDVDGAYWLPYNTRQYAWFFPLKTSLTGYHLKEVKAAEGSIQTMAWGDASGKFWVMIDTNGLGVTNFFEGTGKYHNNKYDVFLVPNEYTLNFNPNEGKIDGKEFSDGIDTTVTYGKKSIKQGAASYAQGPDWCAKSRTVKTGNTLLGWYDAKEGGTKVINADGTKNTSASAYWNTEGKWVGLSNTTLYAHWTPNSYTITYHANDDALDIASNIL